MMQEPERKTVNIEQAMRLAGVSRRTIYNWMRGGKVAFKETDGGAPRIYVDSLHNNKKSKRQE